MATAKAHAGLLESVTHFGAKSFDHPDEVRTFDKGKLELVHLGNISIGRLTFLPGWKWSECIKPIAGTKLCEEAHIGYVVSGRLKIVQSDGREIVFCAGDAMSVPSGHDAWVVGNEPCILINFLGVADYAKK